MVDSKALVREFLEAFSTGDVDAILSFLTDDAVWWVSGRIEGMSGSNDKETLGKLLRSVKPLYKTGALKIIPNSMIAEGEYVAVEAESFAELTTGRIYANQYHFIFKVENGKISHVKEYSDTQHMEETFTG